jgi:hypothetical protein
MTKVRPAFVVSDGFVRIFAPNAPMIAFRKGFWFNLPFIMSTVTRALKNAPAPVSVVSDLTPCFFA